MAADAGAVVGARLDEPALDAVCVRLPNDRSRSFGAGCAVGRIMLDRPRIVINDVDFAWDLDNGLFLVMGSPVVCMWIETTMAGIMSGFHNMLGTERFLLAGEQAGRLSVEGEWHNVILEHPTIEEGIQWIGRAAGIVGLGEFELLSMDHDEKTASFRVRNCWEGLYQRALGVSWGSIMTAGRLAEYCSRAFGTYCRAEQIAFIARGDAHDAFIVRPSQHTHQERLAALVSAERSTQADLVAALERLRRAVRDATPSQGSQPSQEDNPAPAEARKKNGAYESILVNGISFEWDREQGSMLVWGKPVVCMWIDTTMAGLMSGLQSMVGTERFALAAEQAGRESVEGEWEHIVLRQPSIEEGIAYVGRTMSTVGLGQWELLSLNRDEKVARFRGKNSWEGLYQKALGVTWGTSTVAGKFSAYCTKLFGTYCRAEQTSFVARGDAYDELVVRPSDRIVEHELDALIGTRQATSTDLTVAFERLRGAIDERDRMAQELRQEVEERRRVEEELRHKLELIRQQDEAIRTMSMPILRLWEGILCMPVIGRVDATRATRMLESLLGEIARTQARFTIVDLTGVDTIDADAASHLLQLVNAARLLGTRCLVSGISPAMANTVVSLELHLGELRTFGTLETALRFALRE